MPPKDPINWMLSDAIETLARAERLHQRFLNLQPLTGKREPCWEPPIDVIETDLPGLVSLDKYVVDFILQSSTMLRSLGRMTWAKAIATSGNRIDVRQAIMALLQQAGFPLSSNEIRQRLVALRGLSDNFQIYSSEAIVRVDSRRWGLNDRDISLKRSDQPALLEHLAEVLGQRGSGIHVARPCTL
jgi:hypothetical protein